MPRLQPSESGPARAQIGSSLALEAIAVGGGIRVALGVSVGALEQPSGRTAAGPGSRVCGEELRRSRAGAGIDEDLEEAQHPGVRTE